MVRLVVVVAMDCGLSLVVLGRKCCDMTFACLSVCLSVCLSFDVVSIVVVRGSG